VRIVREHPDRECQLGKSHWERYVLGWEIWPLGNEPEDSDKIDWGQYDIIISIDVAIPQRIIKKYPHVLWCYYFIEFGPHGIDTVFKGSPFYGYNIFLNQRLAKISLDNKSREVILMRKYKRSTLDFPYYLLSANSIKRLYPEFRNLKREGIIFSHHSYEKLSKVEYNNINKFGNVKGGYKKLSDIHKLELSSKYFVVHPESTPRAGTAVIEAISAGCLVLSPKKSLWGFPEFISEEFDYKDFNGLLQILEKFECNSSLYERELRIQSEKVDKWCFKNPVSNLETLYRSFLDSTCSPFRQHIDETMSAIRGKSLWNTAYIINKAMARITQRLPKGLT